MKRYNFISAAGATLGALAGAEWYLRQRDHANNRDRWFHEGYDGSHPYNVFHNRSGWELMPGYNVAGIRINQYGFRGDDISKRKDPNVVRIMCLGDSCTFGTAGDESPYPYQLKQCLDTMDLEGDYQTINAGVEGHATINALLRLPRLLTFHPDVLIIYLGWNDMWIGNPKHYPDMRRKTQSYWHYGNGAQTGLRLIDSAKDGLGLDTPPPPIGSFDIDVFIPTNFEFNMERIIRTARKAGVQVVLTTLPTLIPQHNGQPSLLCLEKLHYPAFFAQGDLERIKELHEIYDTSIRQLAMREDVELIDLNAAFSDQDTKGDTYFSNTWLPSVEGNQIIARALADGLYEREIVR